MLGIVLFLGEGFSIGVVLRKVGFEKRREFLEGDTIS